MTEFGVLVASLMALSLTVTKVVDFFRNVLDKQNTWPKFTWNIVALVAGLAICLGWQLDLTGAILKLIPALANSTLAGVSGQILTGLVVGMSAGFWHELLDALSAYAKKPVVR